MIAARKIVLSAAAVLLAGVAVVTAWLVARVHIGAPSDPAPPRLGASAPAENEAEVTVRGSSEAAALARRRPFLPALGRPPLTFQVVDEEGRPAQGARIRVWDRQGDRPRVVWDGIADSLGRADWVEGEAALADALDAIVMAFTGDASGFVQQPSTVSPVNVRLIANAPLSGTLFLPDGQPAPAVRLEAVLRESDPYIVQCMTASLGAEQYAETDASGRFEFASLPVGTYGIVLRDPRLQNAVARATGGHISLGGSIAGGADFEAPAGHRDVALVLPVDLLDVEVKCLASCGQPNFVVTCDEAVSGGSLFTSSMLRDFRGHSESRTGSRVRFGVLPATSYKLLAVDDGGCTSDSASVDGARPSLVDVDLWVTQRGTGTVAIRVLGSEGEPLPASVYRREPSGRLALVTPSSSAGQVATYALPSGISELLVTAYEEGGLLPTLPIACEVDVARDSHRVVTLQARLGGRIALHYFLEGVAQPDWSRIELGTGQVDLPAEWQRRLDTFKATLRPVDSPPTDAVVLTFYYGDREKFARTWRVLPGAEGAVTWDSIVPGSYWLSVGMDGFIADSTMVHVAASEESSATACLVAK